VFLIAFLVGCATTPMKSQTFDWSLVKVSYQDHLELNGKEVYGWFVKPNIIVISRAAPNQRCIHIHEYLHFLGFEHRTKGERNAMRYELSKYGCVGRSVYF